GSAVSTPQLVASADGIAADDLARPREPRALVAPPSRRYRAFHRAFDLLVGIPLAVVVTPVILGLALVSAVSLRTWPVFVQQRIGRNGRHFWFLKIRSLPKDAPRTADKYELQNVSTTAFGNFIRLRHLDELPQLYHVVAGRMSIVGPRPEMPALY